MSIVSEAHKQVNVLFGRGLSVFCLVLLFVQGVVLYSFFDGSSAKVAVAFHGSFSQLPPVLVDTINPYLLM